MHYILSIKP